MPFPPEQVPLFLTVLDSGSFSAAARRLGRVPSAVSMAMGQLEAELGLQLFDRTGREPRPTAAALALEPQARLLAQQLQLLNQQAQALHEGLEQRLTLAIAPELLTTDWTQALRPVVEQYPSLVVEVLAAPQDDALNMLHTGRAQLALVFERPAMDAREDFCEQGHETLVAVMSPQHPWCALQSEGALPALDMSQLATMRQVLVASRDLSLRDTRFVFSHKLWRADNHAAALALIASGLSGAGYRKAWWKRRLRGASCCAFPLSTSEMATPCLWTGCGPRNARWGWLRLCLCRRSRTGVCRLAAHVQQQMLFKK